MKQCNGVFNNKIKQAFLLFLLVSLSLQISLFKSSSKSTKDIKSGYLILNGVAHKIKYDIKDIEANSNDYRKCNFLFKSENKKGINDLDTKSISLQNEGYIISYLNFDKKLDEQKQKNIFDSQSLLKDDKYILFTGSYEKSLKNKQKIIFALAVKKKDNIAETIKKNIDFTSGDSQTTTEPSNTNPNHFCDIRKSIISKTFDEYIEKFEAEEAEKLRAQGNNNEN